ncbi:L-rhamnose isomerase [Rubellicoccus peritrichatus]|uniref:L-rhamnose isomerase n=1 Tax=Rubellicoccus peritrichatus TaxID=3080537 RepID=A0AAQ3LCC4_9BACT|nr:L-rhamnose isomerase [Puniceicoccus sp. CR14]WOO42747.1 L-rhamnose isomerase [Puniceicoccus sp. CR14]
MEKNSGYSVAQELFAQVGVDTEAALMALDAIPVSMHCWQGDDVAGFEAPEKAGAGNGCVATGNYPGKASNPAELMSDIEQAAAQIPGPLRLNLHASYATDGSPLPERDELTADHFRSWIDWAKAQSFGIDFNPTSFSHPKASDGFTLSHQDAAIRQFWIDHCVACRKIGAAIGEELSSPVVNNIWIPDGYKDTPADRFAPRERLLESLDVILAADVSKKWNIDAVESKLFGIGVESYTVGSSEFYLAYAATRKVALCLDAGHFHPTESVADKISAALLYVPALLLHVSRGVRWDSDHVITLDDPTKAILEECVVSGQMDRIHVGLDFFDASINRIAAWVIGTRNAKKGLLRGLLRPTEKLRQVELAGDYTSRLALMEDVRSLPWGAVWNEYCERCNTPPDHQWLGTVKAYEADVLSQRAC